MIIDSSALIALLLAEPEAEQFVLALAAAPVRRLSAASYLETAIVITARSGPDAREKLDRLIENLSSDVVPFTHEQARLAVAGFERFGKGSGHPAKLNYGDCFTYGLAKLVGEPLLFKGNDFGLTDLVPGLSESSQ
jgi:ribonuclease VapC